MEAAINGTFAGVAAIRLDPGEDVFCSIRDYCREHNIRNGVILPMHGSLSRAQCFTVTHLPETSQKYGYSEPLVYEEICELLGGSGTITHEENGTINIHVHCAFGAEDGHTFGGHMTPGNKVLLVTEVVIGIIEDIDLIGVRVGTDGLRFIPRSCESKES